MKVEVNKETGTITLTQGAYLERLLTRFSMDTATSEKAPAKERLSKADQPSTAEDKAEMSKVPYRECIGALQYLAVLTRPDIVFAVNQCSRFLGNPGKKHWQGAKTILRYLKGTSEHGLMFKKMEEGTGEDAILGFSDSDWAGDPDDRRSCSGYVFSLFGNVVSWKSKKQATTALSSCESELMALSMAMKEALWLRTLAVELGIHSPSDPILLYEDNQGAMAIANDAKFSDRTKHIDVRYFRIRDEVRNKTIRLQYCHTSQMMADTFTKPLQGEVFKNIKALLKMATP